MSDKPWAGRFSLPTDKFVEEFNASIYFDKRLYKYDITGSMIHAEMLGRQGIIGEDEAKIIITGLKQVLNEIEQGDFTFEIADEDIHMAVEKRMTQLVGPVGGKLHTARSRNDQVALDFRMYLREEMETVKAYLLNLMTVLVTRAEENISVIMPGYTHLQTAQPVLFAHWLLAYFQMFRRDFSRFVDLSTRMNYCPLGSGALAGTTFMIDRFYTAEKLGFEGPTENSLDSVSDRDFALEFLSAASICQMHLSRFSEELIIFSTSEFKFIELTDDYCTGSSIMPQKKNPDIPELIRGKTGRMYGNMLSLFTTMKGLPLAYNKDMQEDKEPVFDSLDTLLASLKIFAPMVRKMKVNSDTTYKAASGGYATATDLADYLVRKSVPFREAHHFVGAIVGYAIGRSKMLHELNLNELVALCPHIEDDVYDFITVEACIDNRKAYGGTATDAVWMQISNAKDFLNDNM